MEGVTDPIKHMKTIELLNLTYAVSTNKRLNPLQRKLSEKFTNHVKIHTIPIPSYLLNVRKDDNSVNNSIPTNGNGNNSEDKLWCDQCKILLIPGLNLQVRVKYLKDKKQVKTQKKTQKNQGQDNKKNKKHKKSNDKFRKRVLSYKCLDCNKEMIFDELVQPKPETIEIKETKKSGETFKLNTLPNLQFKSSNSQSPEPNTNTITKPISAKSSASTPNKSDSDTRKNDNSKNASSKSRSKKRKQMNSLTNMLKEKKKKQEESDNNGLDLMGFMKL
ncbi:unnamed protein product [[Candida] boidinii]|nr:unnamed protein product [[Candida] boidinii]